MVRTKHLTPVLMAALVAACNSGNNPAGPQSNRGNLPTLANAPPNALPSANVRRVKLQGRVVDALTGEPVEKALVMIQSFAQPTSAPSVAPVTQPSAGSPSAPSSPSASPSPLAGSPAPLMSPGPLLPSSSAGGGFSIQANDDDGKAPSAAPSPAPAKPAYSDRTTTNNEGKFWLNGVPEGSLTISVSAAKYRAVTLVGADPSKLELSLVPQDPETVKLDGKVLSVTGTPVAGAAVSASFPTNGPMALPETSDAAGAFTLEGVLPGERHLVAIAQDKGEVQSFGLLLKRKVSPKEKEGGLLDKLIPKGKPAPATPPQIQMAAVTGADVYEGSLSLPEGMKPRQLHAYLRWDGEEAFLFSRQLDKDSRHFRLELPAPPEGASFHLEFTAQAKDQISYYHVYDLVKSQKDLKVQFSPAPGKLSSIPSETPTFRWSGEGDLFRVVLTDTAKDEIVWEAWTPDTSITYPLTVGGAKLSKQGSYEWRVAAVKDAPGGKVGPQLQKGGWSILSQGASEALTFQKKPEKKEP